MGTKQGCPQDRESSGHVGIHVKKKCTHNFFVCKQTLLPGGVCAHMHIYLHQQILILLCITGFGGVGGLEKPEKITASTLMVCSFPLLFTSALVRAHSGLCCYLWWWRGKKWKLLECISHSAFCQVSGTAEVFQWTKSPPPAQGFCPGEPRHFSSCSVKVRIWPWLNHTSISQRFIHVLYSKPLSSFHWPAETSHGHMYKCLQNWVPLHAEHCTKSHSETTLLVFKKIENSVSLTQAFFFFKQLQELTEFHHFLFTTGNTL